jgi:cobalamin biosynthesis protein CobT
LLYTVSFSGKPDSWKATTPDEFAVVNYPKDTARKNLTKMLRLDTPSVEFFKDNFKLRVRDKSASVDNFAQQVRRLIQIRSKVRYEYGVKKGKLDYPRLSRLALKLPGFSERIFKNKITNSTLDAAVTILIDMSGSMSGDKVLFACEAALLLNSVFSILNVPLEILGFTDTENVHDADTLMYVYKEFSTLHTSEDKLLEYIAASSSRMKGNPDGDCILWSYDRLLKRKEKKRLLIVMSDGQPAASRPSDDLAAYTLKVIQEIEKFKRVEIYGLGLCDESVERFYKHHSTVSTPEDIPFKLLELIERKLLNDY